MKEKKKIKEYTYDFDDQEIIETIEIKMDRANKLAFEVIGREIEIDIQKEEIEELKKEVTDNNVVQEQKRIQVKKFISRTEASKIYNNMSISQQDVYMGRLKDKIPYTQNKKGGKVTYNVKELEEWMDNNNIK